MSQAVAAPSQDRLAKLVKEAQAILAAPATDSSISKSDTIAALAELFAEAPAAIALPHLNLPLSAVPYRVIDAMVMDASGKALATLNPDTAADIVKACNSFCTEAA